MKNKKKQYLFSTIGMVMALFCCGCIKEESSEQVPENVIVIDSSDSSGAAHYLEMMTLAPMKSP